MQIYIVRHGQTAWNQQKLIAGQSDIALNDTGRKQARRLGSRLAGVRFDHIFSSDLARAKETTEYIVEHQEQQPVFVKALRERHWGSDEGKPVQDYKVNVEKFEGEPWAYRPRGGESLEDLKERISLWLTGFLEEIAAEKVLLSAHHSVNKMLIQVLLKRDWPEWKSLNQANTCLNVIEYLGSDSRPVVLNCTKHLKEKHLEEEV